MNTMRVPKAPNATKGETAKRPLDGELLDLYLAIAIVVPIAILLKSLWP